MAPRILWYRGISWNANTSFWVSFIAVGKEYTNADLVWKEIVNHQDRVAPFLEITNGTRVPLRASCENEKCVILQCSTWWKSRDVGETSFRTNERTSKRRRKTARGTDVGPRTVNRGKKTDLAQSNPIDSLLHAPINYFIE